MTRAIILWAGRLCCMWLLCGYYAVTMGLLCSCYAVVMRLLCGCYAVAMLLLCCCYAVAMRLLCCSCCCYAVVMWLLCCCLFHHFFRTFFLFFPYSLQNWKYFTSSKKNCWHVQFIENIFLLQCLKQIATAKELDLRPLGKVIIFHYRQTDRQTNRTFLLYIDKYP